jgi:hypothetical protein
MNTTAEVMYQAQCFLDAATVASDRDARRRLLWRGLALALDAESLAKQAEAGSARLEPGRSDR